MNPKYNRPFLRVVILSIAVILVTLAVGRSNIFKAAERLTMDLRFRMRRSAAVDPRLSLVLVDPSTMDKYNYPVPRRYYAVVASAICGNGASAVLIDRTFEARDPIDQAGGAMLTEAVKKYGNIAFAWYAPIKGTLHLTDPPVVPIRFALPQKLDEIGLSPYETSLRREEVSLPYYEALQNIKWLGGIMTPEEGGDYVERIPLVVKHGDHIYPSLSLIAVCIALKVDLADIVFKRYRILIPTSDGEIAVPTDEKGQIRVNYLGYKSVFLKNTHSMASVYESVLSGYPAVPLDTFKDGIVLIGNSDIMGADMYSTPFGIRIPGVAIHAMVINSILQQRFIGVASWYYNLLALAVSVLLVSFVQRFLSFKKGLLFLIILHICFWAGVVALFQFREILINMSQPIFGMTLAFVGMASHNYISGRRRFSNVRHVFGKSVSQEVLEQIAQETNVEIPLAQREVSALSAHIVDHSDWSENLKPSAFTGELNECLEIISRTVLENGGMINRFQGDGLLALFNVPIAQDDHALRTVKIGIAIQQRISTLNEGRIARGRKAIPVRIGINTGMATAGTLGSGHRVEYTAMGEAIDIAKQIEDVCEAGRVVITENVVSKIGGAVGVEPIGSRSVKARESGIMLYCVVIDSSS